MKVIYTSIPVQLCEYALVNRKHNYLMLYIYLKHIGSGYVNHNNDCISTWASDLNKSERWIRDAIKWLIKKKWVTVNSKKQLLRIASYKQVLKRLNIDSVSAVIFEEEDFSNFKGFCCGATITYYLKRKRYNDRKKWSASIMGDANMSHHFYQKGFYTMPLNYLAKCLGVSMSTANNFKKIAEQGKFLFVKSQIRILTDGNDNKITKDNYQVFKTCDEENAGRIRKGRKYLKIVEPDLIQSQITSRRKRLK
jgi:hypothetical protein